jgi:aminoglycoside phosphotransferase (APT) family kinase protein
VAGKAAALRDDKRLPHVRMALSRKRAMDFFNEHVLPGMLPGREVIDLSQRRVRYKPGKECRVHYRLRLSPVDGDRPRHQIATIIFRPDPAELQEVAMPPGGANGALAGKALFVDAYACLVEFYPADHRLSGLARAVDADAMTGQLRSAGGDFAGATVIKVRVVRYRPGFTCVLRYKLESADGKPFDVMGKLYAKPEDAASMRRKLTSLNRQGADVGLTIPRPLETADTEQLVLMECVPGENMNRTLGTTASAAEARPLIDLAARSLAAFHRFDLEGAAQRTLTRYFRRLGQRLGRIQRVAPDLAARAHEVLDGVDFDELTSGASAPTLTHGDFKPNQFLVADGRAALVDLDRAGIGDPVVDVANFMAVLRKKATVDGMAHFVPLEERFLEQYLAARPDGAVASRARRFEGVALVRMVLAKFERSPRTYARQGANWPWLAVLDEAERCLAGT